MGRRSVFGGVSLKGISGPTESSPEKLTTNQSAIISVSGELSHKRDICIPSRLRTIAEAGEDIERL